ncbi:phosphatidylglycerophosphatase B [Salmonella sp. NCTC 11881]|nr:phosphatidylglycerophosphatase B [Salmonella sp. NCTC 11881]
MWSGLKKTHHIPVDEFYTLKRTERGHLVKEQLAGQQNIPVFLRQHWQKETGFAFPSGHTMFAASWALLAVGLLWPRRRTFTIAFLLVWATGVMGSRLLLGMHWPRDLVVATLISWLLVYPGDLAGAANLRAAYAASRRSARNC